MVNSQALRPRAISRHVTSAENSISSLKALDRWPSTNDNSGKLPAEKYATARCGASRLTNKSFTRINSDGVNVNQHIGLAQCWFRYFDQLYCEAVEIVCL